MPDYIITSDSGGLDFLESINGTDWPDAPIPPVDHACWAQTRGLSMGECVARCACGAISVDRPYEIKHYGTRHWMERNTRNATTNA